MKLVDQSLKKFSADLSSKKPVPGGGSTAALAGAMAAALVGKVIALTVGKEQYRAKVNRLQRELMALVDKDAQAYLSVVKSKGSQAAVKKAALMPLETAEKSLEVLKMAVYAAKHGNQNLRSDALCAVELAQAAIYGAIENVRVNLPGLQNKQLVVGLGKGIDKVLSGANQVVKP